LRVLRGEKHAHHLTAIMIVLQNFLADELTLAVAIGGEPTPFGAAPRLPDIPSSAKSSERRVNPCSRRSAAKSRQHVVNRISRSWLMGSISRCDGARISANIPRRPIAIRRQFRILRR